MKKRVLANIVAVSVVLWALFGWAIPYLFNYEINYALAGQIVVVWIIASVIATPLIGRLLHNLRTKREFEGHLARSRECARLEKLVALADEYDSARTDRERQAIYRKAQAFKARELGLLDDEENKAWLLDSDENLPRAS